MAERRRACILAGMGNKNWPDEIRTAARSLYLRRYAVSEIADMLSVPVRTLYNWADAGRWDDLLSHEGAEEAASRRLALLLEREDKSPRDLKEVDTLVGTLERLQKLLSQAENMEDIITIESAISETEWNIEDLSGTLRHYDALVDFATINVHVSEVYKYSDTEELPENFGDRLSSAMSRGWHSFVNGMEDFAVALAYSWMWLILWAVIIAAAVVILRKIRRRSGMKKPLFKKKNDVKPDDKSGDT